MTKPVDGAEALAHIASQRALSVWLVSEDLDMRLPDAADRDPDDTADLLAALVAENERLWEAFGELDHYTTHSIRCALYQQPWISGAPRCSCGLDAARTALESRNG